jgi:hypothetical protein
VHASAALRSGEKTKVLTSLPSPSVPVSHLYGQNVNDPGWRPVSRTYLCP